MTDSTDTIERLVKEEVDSAKWQAEYAARRIGNIYQRADLLRELAAELPEGQLSPDSLYITGTKDELSTAWAVLRWHGWEADQHVGTEPVPTFSTYFQKYGQGSFRLNFSSKVCRRVQVGTKTEEVPVYEVQCDEEQPGLHPATPTSSSSEPLYSPTDSCDSPAPCEDAFVVRSADSKEADDDFPL